MGRKEIHEIQNMRPGNKLGIRAAYIVLKDAKVDGETRVERPKEGGENEKARNRRPRCGGSDDEG